MTAATRVHISKNHKYVSNQTYNYTYLARMQTEQLVVFEDHKPAAARHLLVIPRTHIANVPSLKPGDLVLGARFIHSTYYFYIL